MKLMIFVALTAALAAPAQAEELAAPQRPGLAAQAQAALASPAYAQPGGWQRRVSRSRGVGGPTKKAVLIGALAGGAAGFLTGAAIEHQLCACGPGAVSGVGAGVGAGGGAAIGWALSLR